MDIKVGLELEYGIYEVDPHDTLEDQHMSMASYIVSDEELGKLIDRGFDVELEYYKNVIEFHELLEPAQLTEQELINVVIKHISAIDSVIGDHIPYVISTGMVFIDDTATRRHSSLHVHLTVPEGKDISDEELEQFLAWVATEKRAWTYGALSGYHLWGAGVYPRYRRPQSSWMGRYRYRPIQLSPEDSKKNKPLTVEIRILDLFDILLVPRIYHTWKQWVDTGQFPEVSRLNYQLITYLHNVQKYGHPIKEEEEFLKDVFGINVVHEFHIHPSGTIAVSVNPRHQLPDYADKFFDSLSKQLSHLENRGEV